MSHPSTSTQQHEAPTPADAATPEQPDLQDAAAQEADPQGDAATGGAAPTPEAAEPSQRHPFEDLPLEDDGMPSSDDLRAGLRAVVDPEIGYNIVDLGLVYDVLKPNRGHVHVRMTLTTMGCPLTEVIHQQCSVILGAMPGVDHVEVEFVFNPPWHYGLMADYVREELRAMGMHV